MQKIGIFAVFPTRLVVEATRVELVSENRFLQLSTSVVYLFKFQTKAADKQAATVRSSNAIQRCEQAEESRSPLRYAAAQAVVLLWATVADLGSYL